MRRHRLLETSERWFRLLQHLYPPDFRDEVGRAMVEAYMDRARDALENGGTIHVVALWLRACIDSLRNGAAERMRPSIAWRRAGNWGRDIELVRRRMLRAPLFAATTIGTRPVEHHRRILADRARTRGGEVDGASRRHVRRRLEALDESVHPHVGRCAHEHRDGVGRYESHVEPAPGDEAPRDEACRHEQDDGEQTMLCKGWC